MSSGVSSGGAHPPSETRAVFSIIASARSHFLRLGLGIVFAVLALVAGLELMGAAGTRLGGMAIGVWAVSSLALRALGGGRLIGRYVERLYAHDAMFRALADIRVWFFRCLANGSAAGLGFRRAGDLLSRLVSDVEALDGIYLRVVMPAVCGVVAFAVLMTVVGRANPVLAVFVCLVFVSASVVLPLMAAKISRVRGSDVSRAQAAMRNAIIDLTSGLREVRAFAGEARIISNLDLLENDLEASQVGLAKRIAIAGASSFLCGQLGIMFVLLGVAGVGFSKVDPVVGCGTLFLAIAAFESISGLTRAGALAGTIGHAATRVSEITSLAPATAVSKKHAAPAGTDIILQDVSFRWAPDQRLIFNGLSLSIPAGARIALLGPSGIGKSSLAALLLKVVSPEGGRLLLGGTDVEEIDENSLRSRIGWLSQATHLFDDTIRNNLTLGQENIADDVLWSSLDAAAIGQFVRSLPEGLDTWLGEGGVKISGGQGRRIALARTLMTGKPILVLDEPAAGLDAQTEREFLLTLNDIATTRTVILIAHRLTGVEKLDHVWRLSDGKVVSVTTGID